MTVKKITQSQLRKIISEAIQTRSPGSPLFTPPKEASGSDDELMSGIHNAIHEELYTTLTSDYSSEDPSQSALGKDEWRKQCLEATEEALEMMMPTVKKIVDRITLKLVNGEYYS